MYSASGIILHTKNSRKKVFPFPIDYSKVVFKAFGNLRLLEELITKSAPNYCMRLPRIRTPIRKKNIVGMDRLQHEMQVLADHKRWGKYPRSKRIGLAMMRVQVEMGLNQAKITDPKIRAEITEIFTQEQLRSKQKEEWGHRLWGGDAQTSESRRRVIGLLGKRKENELTSKLQKITGDNKRHFKKLAEKGP
jgi:hypothetical protein